MDRPREKLGRAQGSEQGLGSRAVRRTGKSFEYFRILNIGAWIGVFALLEERLDYQRARKSGWNIESQRLEYPRLGLLESSEGSKSPEQCGALGRASNIFEYRISALDSAFLRYWWSAWTIRGLGKALGISNFGAWNIDLHLEYQRAQKSAWN
jgi:hypothetical protein